MSTKTRFEKAAKGNSEMACCAELLVIQDRTSLFPGGHSVQKAREAQLIKKAKTLHPFGINRRDKARQ